MRRPAVRVRRHGRSAGRRLGCHDERRFDSDADQHTRRRCVGRFAELHRRTPRHSDRGARAAAGIDRPGAAPALRLARRKARGALERADRRTAAALHAERRRLLVLGRARPPRGSLRQAARDPQGREFRAAAGASPPGGDHRLRSVRLDDIRPPAGERGQPGAVRRHAGCRGDRLRAESRRRLAVGAGPPATAGRLSPVRAAVGLADLRHIGRGFAGVHLRAAERTPRAGKAVPRARAQPPAVHRQQFHELARAAVPAHGEAPAAFGSARRRRGARGRPLGRG